MTGHEVIVNCEEETNRLAEVLAGQLSWPQTLLLKGDLGAGKTSFSRALIRALSGDAQLNVPSPTFTLLQTYDTAKGSVHHYDLYRLDDPEEIFELGWDESMEQALTLIEWPDRAGVYLPKSFVSITINKVKGEEHKRIIRIDGLPQEVDLNAMVRQ